MCPHWQNTMLTRVTCFPGIDLRHLVRDLILQKRIWLSSSGAYLQMIKKLCGGSLSPWLLRRMNIAINL